ncbi:MAG: YegS/Rv2252/BmrU family lipid kinase [Bacteroidaceae bacterium]|nr:YegS/Rv2252/BmrU family lipid kinase [Bacteroidaceae bacterium]
MEKDKRHITFVVNPISGTAEKEQIVQMINDFLDVEKYSFQILYTEYAGHAEEIATQCAKENQFAVVAVGGDGTVNEVGRALTHTHTALGIIPCGSGNGLARHLEISMQARKALEVINEGYVEAIDYGTINRRKFFCTCGVGFDAFVSLKFAEAGKRGINTYIEQSLNASLNYKPETYKVTIDDNETEIYQAFLIACGNAAQYGNNAYIAPKATLTDGFLDVTIISPFTALDVPSLTLQLFTKTIDQNSHIKTLRCKTINIRREKPGVIHFDGDPGNMGANLKVKIHHAGLKVIVPAEDSKNRSVTNIAQEVINGIRQLNDYIFEGIRQRNSELLSEGKKRLQKLTKH